MPLMVDCEAADQNCLLSLGSQEPFHSGRKVGESSEFLSAFHLPCIQELAKGRLSLSEPSSFQLGQAWPGLLHSGKRRSWGISMTSLSLLDLIGR